MTVEEIVEVVRNAAGKLADGLHLLCLAQLGLEGDPFGHASATPAMRPALASYPARGKPRIANPANRAVGAHARYFSSTSGSPASCSRRDPLAVVCVNRLHPLQGDA